MVGGCDSRTAFPKYLEHFGTLGPTKNEATMSSAHTGVARTDVGKRSVGNMKRLHLPGAVQTNFPKYRDFLEKRSGNAVCFLEPTVSSAIVLLMVSHSPWIPKGYYALAAHPRLTHLLGLLRLQRRACPGSSSGPCGSAFTASPDPVAGPDTSTSLELDAAPRNVISPATAARSMH